MTVEQVIKAAQHWRCNRDSMTIAQALDLPESVIYANLWRIREVSKTHRRKSA
jgi:hypothetical protein